MFILVYGVIYNRRSILPVLLSAVVLIVASTFIMDKFYNNWYSYYIIELPLNFEISFANISHFWTAGLLRTSMIPIAFIVYNIYSNFKSGIKQWGWGFNMFAGAGMILMAWFPHVLSGSAEGAMLPAYAIIAILFGTSLNEVLKRFKTKLDMNSNRLQEVVYLLVMLQFVSLIYNPGSLIPSGADRIAGEKFVERISEEKGDIFIPSHGYLAMKAGKKQFAHEKAIYEVYKNDNGEAAFVLKKQIEEAFANKDFAAVIYDDYDSPIRSFDSDSNYVLEKQMFSGSDDFYPVTGWRTRPRYLFKPKTPPTEYFTVFNFIGPMPLESDELSSD
jgi:hypothetical protein